MPTKAKRRVFNYSQPSPLALKLARLARLRETINSQVVVKKKKIGKRKSKEPKEVFIPSGIPEQTLWLPGQFIGMNEILDLAGATFTGTRNQGRADRFRPIKHKLERFLATHAKVAKLKPMARAFFLFTFIEPNKKRDPDNVHCGATKFIFDGLVKAGIFENDGRKQVVGWYPHFEVNKENPGVLIHMLDPVLCEHKIKFLVYEFLTKELNACQKVHH